MKTLKAKRFFLYPFFCCWYSFCFLFSKNKTYFLVTALHVKHGHRVMETRNVKVVRLLLVHRLLVVVVVVVVVLHVLLQRLHNVALDSGVLAHHPVPDTREEEL